MAFYVTKTVGLIVLIIVLFTLSPSAQRKEPEKTIVAGDTMYTLLKPGGIPAIFKPEFVTVSQAKDYYYDEEPLIMVVDGEKAKAYSTWYLDHHEVVNDFINGKAIAVTW